jgi:hypothetical protein
MSDEKHALPSEGFELLPALYPRFTRILRDCGLSAEEVFVLSFIKHSDKVVGGNKVRLKAHIRGMLVEIRGYDKAGSQATSVLNRLEERGLLTRQHIPLEQMRELFPNFKGKEMEVFGVTERGRQTLEDFKERANVAIDGFIDRLRARVTAERSGVGKHTTAYVMKFILSRFRKIAPVLVKACYSLEAELVMVDIPGMDDHEVERASGDRGLGS